MEQYKLSKYLVILFLISSPLRAQAFLDVESGVAFSGYNDVQIPSDTGTKFSLSNDTPSDPIYVIRLRIGYTFADRHTISFLAAPLTVQGSGRIDSDVVFQDKTFLNGSMLTSKYRFDSYRVTYRWDFITSDRLSVGLGLTGKLRSADIALMDDTGYANRDDLGVVPLINFRAEWFLYKIIGLLLDGDALVTQFGRAEDVNLALIYRHKPNTLFRIGYRVLEGGADGGGNVYTFSMFNYITAGVTLSF